MIGVKFFRQSFLCFVFPEELVQVKTSKNDKAYGNDYPEGGVLCTCKKGIYAVASIAQESETHNQVKIIFSGSSSHYLINHYQERFH